MQTVTETVREDDDGFVIVTLQRGDVAVTRDNLFMWDEGSTQAVLNSIFEQWLSTEEVAA